MKQQQDNNTKKSNEKIFGSNFFAFIFGIWLSKLLQAGAQKRFNPQIIPQLSEKDKIQTNYTKFIQIFKRYSSQHQSSIQGLTLIKIIVSFYQKQLILLLIICIITIAGDVFIPLFSREVINYVDEPEKQTLFQKIIYFLEFVVLYSIFITTTNVFYFLDNVKGTNLANMLSLMVYQKALKYPILAMKNFESSEIINYSQMDARRFQQATMSIKQLFCFFIQTIINLILICKVVGFLSFFIGVTMLLIFFGLSYVLFYFLTQLSEQLGEAKDNTVRVAEEILDLMKLIKSNGLQKHFLNKIYNNREAQMNILSKLCVIKAISKFLSAVTSPAIIFGINNMTPGDTFFIIMIFSNIQGQLDFIPINLSLFTLLFASTVRIEGFLLSQQIDQSIVEEISEKEGSLFPIQIQNGYFLWENFDQTIEEKNQQNLKEGQNLGEDSRLKFQQVFIEERKYTRIFNNLNLKLKGKCLTMVIGQIGSGKSSLLNCILNQMIPQPLKNSKVKVQGSIAYCPQKPWIMSGNLRDNIIFFEEYNQQKLDQAIYFSCLTEDLKILKDGLYTEIGQKGINLSGGQKARVSLARALYMNKDIYILDDVLSALDVNVSNFIVKNTLKGYLKQKTIILATHATNFLDRADNLIIINKGQLTYFEGQYCKEYTNNVLKRQVFVENIQKKVNQKDDQIVKANTSQPEPIIEQGQSSIVQKLMIPEQLLDDDTGLQVYVQYFKLNGGKLFVFGILLTLFVWVSLNVLSNIQIQKLESDNQKEDYLTQLYLYIVFAIQYSFILSLGSLFFSSGQVQSGRQIHKQVMSSLIYADFIQFHNRVPKGRILNRLSNDLEQMDQASYELEVFVLGVFSVIATFCIGTYSSSVLAFIPILFVLVLIILLFRYNINSQQSIVRIEKMALSPIASGITEIISGADTIRAYKMSEKFISQHIQKTDYYQRMAFTRIAIQQWLLFRVSFASLIFNYSIFSYCLFFNGKSSEIGLFLTFSMNFLHQVSQLLYIFIQYKNKMVSTQRLMQLRELQPEEGYKNSGLGNNKFQSKFSLNFVNYSARYRNYLPNALININLAIETGTTVGIVGRTGAGKTTLINCILRFLEPSQGTLSINGRQIRQYDICQLRSSMTIIDQEPLLISGTIRQNLDPADEKSDSEILEILEKCNFEKTVKQKGGLYSYISNSSLSAGEKQMICICRALLKNSSIVLIDEATANIDRENDRLIHQVIRSKFKQKTVLIIAHRLTTLKDCDKILVLEEGTIIQWGSQSQLLSNQHSTYRKMWETHDQSYLN